MQPNKIAVAVDNTRKSQCALKWALQNLFSKGDTATIIHISPPILYVPLPAGRFPVQELSAELVAAYRGEINQKIGKFLNSFKLLCSQHGVAAEIVIIENDTVEKALVQQIYEMGIKKLVLGKSSSNVIKRKLTGPGVPEYVSKHAPDFCTVFLITKNQLTSSSSQKSGTGIIGGGQNTDISGGLDTKRQESFSSQGYADTDSSCTPRHSGTADLLNLKSPISKSPGKQPGPNEDQSSEKGSSQDDSTDKFQPPTSDNTHNHSKDHSNHNQERIDQWSRSLDTATPSTIECPPASHGDQCIIKTPTNENMGLVHWGRNAKEAAVEGKSLSDSFAQLELSWKQYKVNREASPDLIHKGQETHVIRGHITNNGQSKTLNSSLKQYKVYTLDEILAATDNFSPDRKLGEGGYGVVFKGRLDFKTVAIKVLKKEGLQGSQEFQHEVDVLGHIHHPNMVALLGCCPEKGCLIYEYMANGSLEDQLFGKTRTPFPWYARFQIAAEAATALHFLHNINPEPIIHRDIKPANILLDHNNISKLADVGLAKLVPECLATTNCTSLRDTVPVGTFAYIDPEYQRTGSFGPRSDIYALGIVVLQLLTGKPPLGVYEFVETAFECGTFNEVLDPSAGEWPLAKAKEVACLALQCAEMRRRQRPKLETILPVLNRVRAFADEFAAVDICQIFPSREDNAITPPDFLCPLLQEVMRHPFVAADGYTYEYDAIKRWLQKHDTSPITNMKLNHRQVLPNYTLQRLIYDWKSARDLCSRS